MWQLAEYLGDATPHGLQRLLDRAVWSADTVRDVLVGYALSNLFIPEVLEDEVQVLIECMGEISSQPGPRIAMQAEAEPELLDFWEHEPRLERALA